MIIETYSYGLCLFSHDKLISFLIKNKKNRVKKLLDFFEKHPDSYAESLRNGVWIPIPKINSGRYKIKILGDIYNIDKNIIFYYKNFNICITDSSLWICDLGRLSYFDKKLFKEKDEIISYTLDNQKIISGIKISMPNGKYSVSIIGFMDNNIPCFSFKFDIVDDFLDFNDPRDDEKYSFSFS